MSDQTSTTNSSQPVQHHIRSFNKADDDIKHIWQLWQAIFPAWPIEQQRLSTILKLRAGHHHIHKHGFCISFLSGFEAAGSIAALGVLPEHRGKGLGTALLETAQDGLRVAAQADGRKHLETFELGSSIPRVWPGVPTEMLPGVEDFFRKRGFRPTELSLKRDLYRDIRGAVAPPEILEKVAKLNLRYSIWSPELYEECMTKQRSEFPWAKAFEFVAAHEQWDEVLVVFDAETNQQIAWSLMLSPCATLGQGFAFLSLLPSKEKTGLVSAVSVAASERGKGIGLALVVKAMENLRDRGVDGVLIDAVTKFDFYARFGVETWQRYEKFAWQEGK